MRVRRTLLPIGLLLLAAGVSLLAMAIALGQAELSLVLIVPVVHGSGPLVGLSVVMLFMGMVVTFLSLSSGPVQGGEGAEEGERKWGGVVLIGPIPIIFGSGRALRGSWVLLTVSIVSGLLLLVFLLTALG